VLALVLAIPIAFNLILLTPQLRTAPSINDSAWHYAFVQSASRALKNGRNPFDFWAPEVECGFPQFLYYQHFPHLAVVALNRISFERIPLITFFNLVRYLLLVGFPLTVFWSMRTMEFPVTAAALGAAFSSLLSAHLAAGFEYNSYLWYGFGLYTQLWAMHLLFIATASMHRWLIRGTNFGFTILAWSLLILSHLFYAFIAVLSAAVLVVVDVCFQPAVPIRFAQRVVLAIRRLGAVAALTALVTVYFWLPYLLEAGYIRRVALPYVNESSAPMLSAISVLAAMRGNLLDYGRPPVLTVLCGAGFFAALLNLRSLTGRVALALSGFWAVLYFILPWYPHSLDWIRLGSLVATNRFIGPLQMSVIILIGLAGEWIWSWFARFPDPWRAALPGALMVALMVPALRERAILYRTDAGYVTHFTQIFADQDWRDTIATLKSLPAGRVFLVVDPGRFSGQNVLERLLLFYDLETLQTATGLSLNTFAPVRFDGLNPLHYNLFNVRYVIVPTGFKVPWFLTAIKSTRAYTLYRADTTGYTTFARVTNVAVPATSVAQAQDFILRKQAEWLYSSDAATGTYWRWDYAGGGTAPARADSGAPESGEILNEKVGADRIVVHANCIGPSNLIFKVTYHPNWHVTVDGREQPTFMASPSYLGVAVPPGRHEIAAEYRSSLLKKLLLLLGACVVVGMIWCRRLLDSKMHS